MRNGRRQGGFSLLEVLVAFAIFSAGLGIIFQVYSVGSRAAAAGADYAAAALVARARLAEAGILDPRNSAEYRGTEDRRYDWVVRVSPVADAAPDLAAQSRLVQCEVVVEVSWEAPGGKRALRLETLKLLPAP